MKLQERRSSSITLLSFSHLDKRRFWHLFCANIPHSSPWMSFSVSLSNLPAPSINYTCFSIKIYRLNNSAHDTNDIIGQWCLAWLPLAVVTSVLWFLWGKKKHFAASSLHHEQFLCLSFFPTLVCVYSETIAFKGSSVKIILTLLTFLSHI